MVNVCRKWLSSIFRTERNKWTTWNLFIHYTNCLIKMLVVTNQWCSQKTSRLDPLEEKNWSKWGLVVKFFLTGCEPDARNYCYYVDYHDKTHLICFLAYVQRSSIKQIERTISQKEHLHVNLSNIKTQWLGIFILNGISWVKYASNRNLLTFPIYQLRRWKK